MRFFLHFHFRPILERFQRGQVAIWSLFNRLRRPVGNFLERLLPRVEKQNSSTLVPFLVNLNTVAIPAVGQFPVTS